MTLRPRLAFATALIALAAQHAVAGNEKYLANCVACHGPDLKGVEGLGVNLLTSKFVATQGADQLVAFIKVGRMPDDPASATGRPMPGLSWLPETELREIADYVKATAGK
jgi:mono/diheme cytochrome c family protein